MNGSKTASEISINYMLADYKISLKAYHRLPKVILFISVNNIMHETSLTKTAKKK